MRASQPILVLAALVALGPRPQAPAQTPAHYRAVVEARFGDIDGPVALTHVASLVAVGDTLFLTQALSKEIRVLSVDGEPLATWGRHGDGPGEYQSPERLGLVDGNLVVVDWVQGRLTYLDMNGQVVATLPQPESPSATHWISGPTFHGADGKVIVLGSTIRRLPEQWEMLPGLVFDRDDQLVDSIFFRFGRRVMFLSDDRGEYSRRHPIQDGGQMAMSPDGELLVTADHAGPGARLHLARYHVSSGQQDTLFLPFQMVPVPRSFADSVESAIVESQAAVVQRFGFRKVRDAARSPERIPAADALVVTNEGEIWLRRPSFGVGPDLWLVVKPTGEIRAEVEVPHGLELMAAEGSTLWAHHQDEYWVSYISRLRLEARE